MPLELEIINPLVYPDWDKLVLSTPNYSFFHSSAWARVLYETYKYKPLYFTLIKNNQLSALIPFMEVGSVLTGKRGVSLPFSDYCETIGIGKDDFQDAINLIKKYGKGHGWKSLEFRDGNIFPEEFPPSSGYVNHTLEISENPEQIFSSFRDSTKRNIKKAEREGVEIKILSSLESVHEFFRLNCITRKRHGLPPQSYNFFKKIYEHILSQSMGIVVLAIYNKITIAGAIYFHFGDKVIYKFGASDTNYNYLRPNNLIMWEAIKFYSKMGYKGFCFGRTEQDNIGLIQFKDGWRAKKEIIKYYIYDLRRESYIQDSFKVSGMYHVIFQKMPLPLLKFAGSFLYRHIG